VPQLCRAEGHGKKDMCYRNTGCTGSTFIAIVIIIIIIIIIIKVE